MYTFNIDLDIDKAHAYLDQLVIHRIGDTSTKIVASIYDKGIQADVTKVTNVVFKCVLPNGKKVIETTIITDNTIAYTLSDRFNKIAGNVRQCCFEFDGYSTQIFDIKIIDK